MNLMNAALVLSAMVLSLNAFGERLLSVTTKTEFALVDQEDDFPGSAHICYDLDAREKVDAANCRLRSDRTRRLCSLLIYNLAAATPVDKVGAGAEFLVRRQIGAKIDNDWDKRVSLFKAFANRSGEQHDFENPNLIIECRQSFKNNRTPAIFALEEIAEAMRSEVSLGWFTP